MYSTSGGFKFPDNTVQTTAAVGDNLGNHTAIRNLQLGTNRLVGTGSTGLSIGSTGEVSAAANVALKSSGAAYEYAVARSYTQQYGLSELQPENSSQGTTFNATTDNFYATSAGATFRIPLHLPQGATVSSTSFFFFDNSSGDLAADVVTYNPGTDTRAMLIGSLGSSGTPGAGGTVSYFPIGAPVIDNTSQPYSLRLTFGAGATNLTFRGFSITYTVTQAD